MPPIVNPFAQINASLPPLTPNPADLAPPPVNIPDDGTALQKIPQTSTGVKVFHPVTPQEREGQMLGGRLEQDYQKDLHPWGTPENHPGVFGKIGHALSVATGGPNRRLMEEQGLENRVNSLATQEQENELRAAQAGEVGARQHLTEEQTTEMPGETAAKERLEGAQADKLEHPAEEWQPVTGWQGPNNEPMEYNKNTGVFRAAPGGAGASLQKPPQEKATTPEEQAFQGYIAQGMTPMQAWEKVREKPASEAGGTWQLAEDKNGNPVLFNTKTAALQAAPGGLEKTGTHAKAEAATQGAESAINYATDYVNRGVFTGPGDEALQEKFFELAKPTTGFRMTQPQIDMLQNSRSWMNSLTAHIRHATTGTWFSPEQRQQIVQTMNQLAEAKRNAASGGQSATPQSTPKQSGPWSKY